MEPKYSGSIKGASKSQENLLKNRKNIKNLLQDQIRIMATSITIPKTMLGAVFHPGNTDLVLDKNRPVHLPGKGEVLLKILATGGMSPLSSVFVMADYQPPTIERHREKKTESEN